MAMAACNDVQLDHGPPGVTCHVCQRAPSELVVKASSRPSAFASTKGYKYVVVLGGVPREAQFPQLFPITVCQICQSAPSLALTTISRCPSLFCATEGGPAIAVVGGLLSEAHWLQGPSGPVGPIYQSAPSAPGVKASSRPSVFSPTPGASSRCLTAEGGFPDENQLNQPLPGAVCQICQRFPSSPMEKTSMRPSAFLLATGIVKKLVLGGRLSEVQVLQLFPGVICQICQRFPSEPLSKTSSRPSAFCTACGELREIGRASW